MPLKLFQVMKLSSFEIEGHTVIGSRFKCHFGFTSPVTLSFWLLKVSYAKTKLGIGASNSICGSNFFVLFLYLFIFFFLEKIFLWPTSCVVEADLELLSRLPPPPKC